MSKVIYRERVIQADEITPSFQFKGMGDKHIGCIVFKVGNEDIDIYGKPQSAVLRLLGSRRKDLMKNAYDVADRTTSGGKIVKERIMCTRIRASQFILDLWKKSTVKAWKILYADGNVARITSHYYEGIPHKIVIDTIRNRLNAENIEWNENIEDRGGSGVFTFESGETKKVGNVLHNAISFVNQNDGVHALKVYGGAMVLICSNGLISHEITGKVRITHRRDMKDAIRKIDAILTKILSGMDILPKQFLRLKKYPITKDQAVKIISQIPVAKYVQMGVARKLFGWDGHSADWDGTMWGVYMASTWIGTHMHQLQDRKKVRDIVAKDVANLQAIETYSEMWDKREAVWDSVDAKRVKEIQSMGATL